MDNQVNEESRERWNAFADSYAQMTKEQGDTHKEIFLTPNLLALAGDVNGKAILDAGCGEGYLSRLLHKRGADVTGVDFSDRMIDIAKERTPKKEGIRFSQGNLEQLDELQDNQFDIVVSNMVLQDVSNLNKALSEVYRVLKEDGSFIFSILHPCFITSDCGWERNDKGEKLHWNVDQYFKEGQFEQNFGAERPVFAFHRTLSTYMNTFLETGFRLEKVIEPVPSKADLVKFPQYEEDLRAPDFIIFKVKK